MDSDQGKEMTSAPRDADALSCEDLVEAGDMKKLGSIWLPQFSFDGPGGGQLHMVDVKIYKPTLEHVS